MDSLAQLSTIINDALSNDSQKRLEGESCLQKLREMDINNYISQFCKLLNDAIPQEVRHFSIVHLHRMLSNFPVSAKNSSVWHLLNSETQKHLKDNLFTLLAQETNTKAATSLCGLIGELGATIKTLDAGIMALCSEEGQQWNELLPKVWGLLKSDDEKSKLDALKIMKELVSYCGQEFAQYTDELFPILKESLKHENLMIKTVSLASLSSLVINLDSKESKKMVHMLPQILTNLLTIIDIDEELASNYLDDLSTLIELEPKLFKKYQKEIFETIKMVTEKDLGYSYLKEASLNIVIAVIRGSPRSFSTEAKLLRDLFEMCFSYMRSSVEDPNSEWENPPEGFIEAADDDDSPIKFCMTSIDQVINDVGEKNVLPILSEHVLRMLTLDDWKSHYSALMVVSQVAEYITIDKLRSLISTILPFLNSPQPKVRFAALQCIGQFADGLNEDFAEKYSSKIIPLLIKLFDDDVPRVVNHALAALSNMLEHCSLEQVQPYAQSILEPCFRFLEDGISIIKENAVRVVSSTIEALGEDFTKYWEKAAEIVLDLLKKSTANEQKAIQGACIECLTVMGEAVGETEFRKISTELIKIMLDLQESQLELSNDQKCYLLSGWHRISLLMEKNFVPYLEKVMPSLFKIIDSTVKQDMKKQQNLNSHGEIGFNYETEDRAAKTTRDLLTHFIKEFGKAYVPYLEKSCEILASLLQISQDDDVRFGCAQSFAVIIKVVKDLKEVEKDYISQLVKRYECLLWDQINREFLTENMTKFVNSLKAIILAEGQHMDQIEINEFSQRIRDAFRNSEARKNETDNYADRNQNDLDEEDQDLVKGETVMEEELQFALTELMGALFASHKKLDHPLLQYIRGELLPRLFEADNSSSLMKKAGLILIDSILQCLDIEVVSGDLDYYIENLARYAGDEDAEVRQAAVCGIGFLAEMGEQRFSSGANVCAKALFGVIKRKKELYLTIRYNAVAALGNIIKYHYRDIELKDCVKVWISQLPLKNYAYEPQKQHDLFVNILLENTSVVVGEQGERLNIVLQILAEVVGTGLCYENFKEKVVEVFNLFSGKEEMKPLLYEAFGKLEKKWQEKLEKIVF